MPGRRDIAPAGRSSASESLMRAGSDPRSRRANQASLATNVELGDNLEMDSKQRIQVIKAASIAKLDSAADTATVISTVNALLESLKAAGLMRGQGRSY